MQTPASLLTGAIGFRPLMRLIIAALCCVAMLCPGGFASAQIRSAAPGNIRITFASQVPQAGVISTRSQAATELLVQSGQLVRLARQSGRDYQLRAGGFYWTQVQEIPANAESVAVTPTLQDDGSVEVALEVAHKQGTRMQRYSSTLIAAPGEWLQLFGPAQTQSRGTTVYGTSQAAEDSLYLKVEY